MHTLRARRPPLVPLICVAAFLTAGCVSSAQHRSVLEERDRLARENEDLRRSLAEQKVRAEEALEALRAGGRPAAAEAGREPTSEAVQPPPAAPPAGPQGIAPPPAAVEDEDLRSVPPGSGAAGEEGLLRAARAHAAAGRPREAIDVYSRLIQDYPFSPTLPEAFLERGREKLKTGDRTGALEDFDAVAEAFPRSAQALEARRLGDSLRRR